MIEKDLEERLIEVKGVAGDEPNLMVKTRSCTQQVAYLFHLEGGRIS